MRSRSPAKPAFRVLAAPASMPANGNPYITSLYNEVRARGIRVDELNRRAMLAGYDVIHVHWPELLVRWTTRRTALIDTVKVLAGLWVARLRGTRLIWTGHDLGPHDMPYPRMYRLYIAAFTLMVDQMISLGESSTASLKGAYPAIRRIPVKVIPHGHYRESYDSPGSRAEARSRLGLPGEPATVFLLLGQIRRYKNVPSLIQAFVKLRDHEAHLAVAGAVRDPMLKREVAAAARGDGSITLALEAIPDSDIPVWHAAADVVVLPYSQATSLHSGAALLALSMNRPVVAFDSGTMRELRATVGSQWVYTFKGGSEEALKAAKRAAREAREDAPDLSLFDWSRIGESTVAVYREAAKRPR